MSVKVVFPWMRLDREKEVAVVYNIVDTSYPVHFC
jgi:hypothetical protein